ncbi:hypothetical protein HPB50_017479 [Hyalomma asiaticum]|uniref:Uncharacterized protein n=1 Tax=Hyalomma asiaticum TaxID=266040 RepID=A0ACB7RTT0_HYAAI|nr:hypothetical protein HPB50_017479 [Hyalomma asiaticum]
MAKCSVVYYNFRHREGATGFLAEVYSPREPLRIHLRLLNRPAHHLSSLLPTIRPGCIFSRGLDCQGRVIPVDFAPTIIPGVPPWIILKPLVRLQVSGISKKSCVPYAGLK